MSLSALLYPIGATALLLSSGKLRARLRLSRAKHRSLAGHARLARRVAAQIPFYGHDEDGFFGADGATAPVVARRRDGFARAGVADPTDYAAVP